MYVRLKRRNCSKVQFQWALSGVTVAVKTWLLWHCLLPFAGISTKTFTNWVQLVAASFVLSRYVNGINDIVKIGWLPVRQQRDFHVLKLVHKALHSPSWRSCIPLDTVKHLWSLWSGAATRLISPMERGAFQDSAAKLFLKCPSGKYNRNCSAFKVYCREVNAYLLNNIS